MSKKPYIKIVYPDASDVAMLLTEAMVRRASGRRVVETESAEREHAGQDLFAGTLCCVTETSVELTLNLAPEALDFALATLIAKNLTQSERDQAMAASDSLELDALFAPRAQAAQAPGQALDGDSSADVPPAERESETQSGNQIPAGKISDADLREILLDLAQDIDKIEEFSEYAFQKRLSTIIEEAINKINTAAQASQKPETEKQKSDLTDQIATVLGIAERPLVSPDEIKSLEKFAKNLCAIIRAEDPEMQETYLGIGDLRRELIHARYFGGADANQLYADLDADINPNTELPWSEYEAYELREDKTAKPPRDKIAAAVQKKNKTSKGARKNKVDKADETDKTDDIAPGLLNDIEDTASGDDEAATLREAAEEERHD